MEATQGSVVAPLFDHQLNFVRTNAKYAAMVGGYGSGKTYALCHKVLYLIADSNNPGLPGMIVEPTYRMAVDVAIPSFTQLLDDYGFKYGRDYTWRKTDFKIIFYNGSEVWFRSADRPDKLKGPSLAWALLDEGELMKKDVWLNCKTRVREPRAGRLFCGAVSTSGDFGWLYDVFVINHSNDPKYYIQYGISSRKNTALPDDYVEDLLADMTAEEVRAYIDGEFYVSKEGKVHYPFNRAEHLVECPYERDKVIGLGMDFNVHPATASAFQPFAQGERWGDCLTRYWTEPNSSTEDLGYKLLQEFGTKIPIYYDFTGRGRQHATGESDLHVLKQLGFENLKAKPVKSFKDKINHINRSLRNALNEVRLFVGKQCAARVNKLFPSVVECLENARWNERRDNYEDEQYSHLLDDAAYFLYNLRPIKPRLQFGAGGRAAGF
jgi:hypothetical protein